MKKFDHILLIFLFIFAGPFFYAQEDSIESLLEEANAKADEKIDQMVDPELIALQMKYPYPIPNTGLPLNEIFKSAIKTVNQEIAEGRYFQKDEDLLQELEKQYKPFKIGEIITVHTKLNLMKTITGRYNSNNAHGQIQIGKRWIALIDLDEETRARFDQEEAQKLIKKKFALLKNKKTIVNENYQEKRIEELTLSLLKKNYYVPVNKNENDPKYMDIDNWIPLKQSFNNIINDKKNEYRDKIVEEYMTQHDCYYDENFEVWRSNKAPKVNQQAVEENQQQETPPLPENDETQQNPPKKTSIFDKLKKIF